MKIIIFSAHPDDLETGMGGTAQLLKKAGHEIISIVGFFPPYGKIYEHEGFEEKEAIVVRKEECKQAHAILDLEPRFLPYTELNPKIGLEDRIMFADMVRDIKPDAVFTHWPVDVNPDHRVIAALSMEACLQKGVNIELFCYEVFSEVGRPQSLGFIPTHYCDVGNELAGKEFMIRCHKSQGDHKLWLANTEMLITRGMETSNRQDVYAEAFIRLTRYGSLHDDLAKIFKTSEYDLPHSTGVEVDPTKIGLVVPV